MGLNGHAGWEALCLFPDQGFEQWTSEFGRKRKVCSEMNENRKQTWVDVALSSIG
jgi:hypothetical protein